MTELIPLLSYAAALVAAGIVAGVIAGLLGIGGGIVLVPTMYWLFPAFGVAEDVRMHLAVGTSLATIIATSLSSARAHARRGAVDMTIVRRWIIPIVLGVLIGLLIAAHISGKALAGVFAVMALAVAVNLVVRPENESALAIAPGRWVAWTGGTFTGCVSVLMGIGGGTLSVAILTAFNYPIHRAVGTAALIGLVIALPGTIGFIADGWNVPGRAPFSLGYVNLVAVAAIIPATTLMAPVGAKLAHAVNPRLLRRIFALFLAITAIRLGMDAFG